MGLAQTAKADSLKSLLGAAKGQQYVDLLNKIGEVTYERHIDTAFVYANKAFNLASVQAYQLGMAEASRVLGYYYIEKGELVRATAELSNALAQYAKMGNTRGEALCNKGLGNAYFKQGLYDKAIEHYNFSLEQAKKIDDKALASNLLSNIASVYNKFKNYTKALEYYEPLAKYYAETEDSMKLAIIYTNIGNSYINLNDPTSVSRGVGYLMKSVQIRRMIGDKKGLAASYNNLAYVFANRGDFKKGIDYMQQSLDTYKETGDKERIASSMYLIGELYSKATTLEGYLPKAQEYTEASLALAREGNYRSIALRGQVALAYIMEKRGEFVAAEKAFGEAYTQLLQGGDTSQAKNVLIRSAVMQDTIADGLVLAKKYTEAVVLYEKAIPPFQQYSNWRKLASVYEALMNTHKKLGNKAEAARYSALYQDTIAILDEEARKEKEARLAAAAAAEAEAEAKERARKEAEREDRRQEEEDDDE